MVRLLVFATFACVSLAFSDDWTSFRNNPQQQGVAESVLEGDLSLRWEKDAVDGIVATAAIKDGRVYCGTLSGEFWCLDAVTGDEIWVFKTPADETDFRAGFNSPPTLTETTVFVGDEDGVLYALAVDSGRLAWKKQTDDEIVGGAAIVGAEAGRPERVVFGSHDGKLYCLTANDGAEVWTFQTDGPINCTVALARERSEDGDQLRTFVAGCDEQLRVIDVETGNEVGMMPLGSPLIASPAIDGNTLFVGSYAGAFSAIDWTKLEVAWAAEPGRSGQPIHSSAAVTKELVIVGGRDRNVRAYDRSTGDERWSIKTRSKVDGSPVVSGNRVYIGTGDKRVLGLNLASGEIEWEYAAGRPIAVGAAIAEGIMVIGTEGPRGKLLCFE